MTAHQLAKTLLELPDIPVVMNGWSSDGGFSFEVSGAKVERLGFNGSSDTEETPRNPLGFKLERECLMLEYEYPVPEGRLG